MLVACNSFFSYEMNKNISDLNRADQRQTCRLFLTFPFMLNNSQFFAIFKLITIEIKFSHLIIAKLSGARLKQCSIEDIKKMWSVLRLPSIIHYSNLNRKLIVETNHSKAHQIDSLPLFSPR